MNQSSRAALIKRRALSMGASALLVATAVFAVPGAAFAAGGTIEVDPASVTGPIANGDSFTVHVVAKPGEAITGASATLSFDPAKLIVTDFTTASNGFSGYSTQGFPSAAKKSQAIAAWNAFGKVMGFNNTTSTTSGSMAYFTTDSSQALTSGGTYRLFTVTFQAIAAFSTASLSIAEGANDAGMLALDGSSVTITTVGSTVTGNPSASPSASPTSTPAPSLVPDSKNITVSGTLTGPTISLTIDATAGIPLVRGATNVRTVYAVIDSNAGWSLVVSDPTTNTDTRGHMTFRSGKLSTSMKAYHPSAVSATTGDINPLVDLATLNGGAVYSSQNAATVPVILSQYVDPLDGAGSYAIILQFSAQARF